MLPIMLENWPSVTAAVPATLMTGEDGAQEDGIVQGRGERLLGFPCSSRRATR